MLCNGQHGYNNKEIPGELETIQKTKQRMPAHLTSLLRPYQLLLLHKNNRQILVHRIWYWLKTLNKSQQFWHSWQQSGEALRQPCFSTGSKGTAMQKPGNNAKAFGSSRQVVHKH
jgi:hypothetical protein